jgi:hypothetical protein
LAAKKIVYSSALATVVAVLIYLSSIPGVKIKTSGDITCAGTIVDPCISYFNITSSNYSLKFYKFDQRLTFSPEIKNYTIYRYTYGKWRETKFPINMTKGTLYQFKIIGYKINPSDKIKWAISSGDAEIDPYWLGTSVTNWNWNITKFNSENWRVNFTSYPKLYTDSQECLSYASVLQQTDCLIQICNTYFESNCPVEFIKG